MLKGFSFDSVTRSYNPEKFLNQPLLSYDCYTDIKNFSEEFSNSSCWIINYFLLDVEAPKNEGDPSITNNDLISTNYDIYFKIMAKDRKKNYDPIYTLISRTFINHFKFINPSLIYFISKPDLTSSIDTESSKTRIIRVLANLASLLLFINTMEEWPEEEVNKLLGILLLSFGDLFYLEDDNKIMDDSLIAFFPNLAAEITTFIFLDNSAEDDSFASYKDSASMIFGEEFLSKEKYSEFKRLLQEKSENLRNSLQAATSLDDFKQRVVKEKGLIYSILGQLSNICKRIADNYLKKAENELEVDLEFYMTDMARIFKEKEKKRKARSEQFAKEEGERVKEDVTSKIKTLREKLEKLQEEKRILTEEGRDLETQKEKIGDDLERALDAKNSTSIGVVTMEKMTSRTELGEVLKKAGKTYFKVMKHRIKTEDKKVTDELKRLKTEEELKKLKQEEEKRKLEQEEQKQKLEQEEQKQKLEQEEQTRNNTDTYPDDERYRNAPADNDRSNGTTNPPNRAGSSLNKDFVHPQRAMNISYDDVGPSSNFYDDDGGSSYPENSRSHNPQSYYGNRGSTYRPRGYR